VELDELRERVKQAIQGDGIALNDLSLELGTKGASVGTLSLFLNGKYSGDSDKISQKLTAWLATRERRQEISIPEEEWIETPTAQSIFVAIRFAHENRKIAAIYGTPGVGKTMTCAKYVANSKDSAAWLVRATVAEDSLIGIFTKIARALGITAPSTRKPELYQELLKRLVGSKGVLIIDEVQRLSFKVLDAVRDLFDEAGIGLVLCGDIESYARLINRRNAVKCAPLTSRIGKQVEITSVNAEDLAMVLDHWAVTDDEIRKCLAQAQHHPAALRVMRETFVLALNYAAGSGTLELSHIEMAWEDRQITSASIAA